ncbi:benzoate/H(+) symporter BenE family transporter [Alteromonas australica]|uniref:Benzoate transporter n=1 Tax=Alteromonas australica TaxID=589873 RepID=A0A075NTG2_9ALTE|nr:benzoate/H(+) symporter BenE family transporter [Alteromonas australica]AIF97834.1 benzoate transporter [Alteromonas australica]
MIPSFSLRHVTAGFTAVVVGYSSAIVIVIDLARKAGANDDMIISWLLALGLGMGVSCIIFSWLTKMPVVTAWSTPGAAFLIGNVGDYTLAESIGAFVVCALLSLATAQSTLLLNAIKRIPSSISSALLAGILLPICLAVFVDVGNHPFIVFLYLAAYILGSLFFARYLMLMLLALSIVVSYSLQGVIDIHFTPPIPVWVTPTFSLSATIGLAIPLFIITTLSQNLPGIAIHHAHGYTPQHKPILSGIALIQLVLAPFGGFTFNLAAITAALCMGKDADPDKNQRYKAAIMAGCGYLLMGALASLVVVLFVAMPVVVVHLLAGLALLATLKTSLAQSLRDEQHRHAALVTFLCTASGFTFLTISSAVWGLLLGLILLFVERRQK